MLTKDFAVYPVPILNDNYVWILVANQSAWIIDPGEAQPVVQFCHSRQLQPMGILLTHQHQDHWAAVATLKAQYSVPVCGPRQMPRAIAPLIDQILEPGDSLHLAGHIGQVVALPGHTAEHIGFYLAGSPGHLFSGDTLFSCGCGRAFYSVDKLFDSIAWIRGLPPDTWLYPSHEYTAANWRFALAVEPNNPDLISLGSRINGFGAANPSLPVQLSEELRRNPFLRYDHISVQKSAQLASGSSFKCDRDVFSALRAWKNVF